MCVDVYLLEYVYFLCYSKQLGGLKVREKSVYTALRAGEVSFYFCWLFLFLFTYCG